MFKWFWTIFSLVAPDHKLEQQIDILLKVQVEFRHFWQAKASGRKGYINTKGWRLSTCTSSRSWIKGILARQMATTCPNVKWKDEFSVPSLNTSWMVFCLLLLSSGELSFKKQQNNTPRIRKSNLKLQTHFFALSPQKDRKKERKRPVYENQTWENVHTVCILHTEISENNYFRSQKANRRK